MKDQSSKLLTIGNKSTTTTFPLAVNFSPLQIHHHLTPSGLDSNFAKMSLAQATKKRKRDEAEENDQEQITFSVLDHSHSSVGPVLGE